VAVEWTTRSAELAEFRDTVVVPLSHTDPEKWPIRSGRVMSVVGGALAEEFMADVEALRAHGWSRADIADCFGNPSRIWRFSHHLLQGLRSAGASRSAQRNTVLLLLDLIGEMKHGSPFLVNGANLWLQPAAAAELEAQLAGVGQSGDLMRLSQVAHRTAATLWSYAECLYFVAHEIGVEIHGPYPSADGSVLLVRDYFRPDPVELWPEFDSFLEYTSLRMVTRYNAFSGELDVYNNLYLGATESLPAQTSSVLVLRDGEPLDLSDLEEIQRAASNMIATVVSEVDNWDLVTVSRRYAEIFWWRKRELALAARGQWRPSEEVLALIRADAIPDASSKSPSIEKLRMDFDFTNE
jgi:hypothetical protein